MIFDPRLTRARLVRRYKRFLADVTLQGETVTVHCPDPGSMRGCCTPGASVWLSHSSRPGRRYPWTWEQVKVAGGAQVGINTARANALVREALGGSLIGPLAGYTAVRAEVRYGEEGSRMDFLVSGHPQRADCAVEVKSVTACAGDGLAMFPDAVSTRATRHLRELVREVSAGRRGVLVFCVQRDDVQGVRPADEIDPRYGQALRDAMAAGVEVLAYAARVTPRETVLYRPLSVITGSTPRTSPRTCA